MPHISETLKNLKVMRILIGAFFYVIFPIGTIWYLATNATEHKKKYLVEQQTTCPSLLSIARSSRDTLIIMRDKEMCTEFVLVNLK